VRKPPSNLPIASETSALAAAKTGQVLVRTSRHPSVPKIESNQLQKLAMSGALTLGSPFDVTFNGTNKSGVFGLSNLRVSCELVCFKFQGRSGSAMISPKPSKLIVPAIGPDHLPADQTMPFICNLRGAIAVDKVDAANGLPTIAISFTSEYDNPWWLWFRRKAVQSETFSLNTRAVPPQWVRGEMSGLCDF
jgi:hypothetical protein